MVSVVLWSDNRQFLAVLGTTGKRWNVAMEVKFVLTVTVFLFIPINLAQASAKCSQKEKSVFRESLKPSNQLKIIKESIVSQKYHTWKYLSMQCGVSHWPGLLHHKNIHTYCEVLLTPNLLSAKNVQLSLFTSRAAARSCATGRWACCCWEDHCPLNHCAFW